MDNSPPRPLAIIKVGDTFEALREQQGDFEHWIADGLGATCLPVMVLDPRRGDKLPAADAIAGAIVTGSHAMVSHREGWSEATGAWLRELVAHDTPVLGICFGHQLLADALGGEAGDRPGGLELGTVAIELLGEAAADPLLQGLPPRFGAQMAHRQSALRLPADAVRLAGTAAEPNQAFRIGRSAWGLQFHPEFDAEAMRGYVELMAQALRAEGQDAAALRERVAATPASAQLLGRFARIAEQHDAAA